MAENTIPPIPAAANYSDLEPLDYVCDMEEPLAEIHDLLGGLLILGQGLNDGSGAVCTISDIAREKCERVQRLRERLFHDLHPNNREAAQ